MTPHRDIKVSCSEGSIGAEVVRHDLGGDDFEKSWKGTFVYWGGTFHPHGSPLNVWDPPFVTVARWNNEMRLYVQGEPESALFFVAPSMLGFRYISYEREDWSKSHLTACMIPLWAIAAFTSVLPTWQLIKFGSTRRKRRRLKAGLCPKGSYDLRATPDRCPECGTIPRSDAGPAEKESRSR